MHLQHCCICMHACFRPQLCQRLAGRVELSLHVRVLQLRTPASSSVLGQHIFMPPGHQHIFSAPARPACKHRFVTFSCRGRGKLRPWMCNITSLAPSAQHHSRSHFAVGLSHTAQPLRCSSRSTAACGRRRAAGVPCRAAVESPSKPTPTRSPASTGSVSA